MRQTFVLLSFSLLAKYVVGTYGICLRKINPKHYQNSNDDGYYHYCISGVCGDDNKENVILSYSHIPDICI
jgi:hypothetical protein